VQAGVGLLVGVERQEALGHLVVVEPPHKRRRRLSWEGFSRPGMGKYFFVEPLHGHQAGGGLAPVPSWTRTRY
jgi:hypothetical protein